MVNNLLVYNELKSSNDFNDFFIIILDFLQKLFNTATKIWDWLTTEINIGLNIDLLNIHWGVSLTPIYIVSSSLVVVLGFVLIKKIVPVA